MTDKKIFLILDQEPNEIFLTVLESLSQIDSLFVYSSIFNPEENNHVVNRCRNDEDLLHSIEQSLDGLEKQTAAFSLYNQKEKATRDLSKESGSFLFFQLFKTVLLHMPQTDQSKQMMINICRDYYRGNTKELTNIAQFDLTYRSSDAIQWYTKETFVYKYMSIDFDFVMKFFFIDLLTKHFVRKMFKYCIIFVFILLIYVNN